MSTFAQALLWMLAINALSWLAGFIMGRLTAPQREIPIDLSDELPARIRRAEGAESNVVQLRREG